jgi:hypothetical protein
MLTPEYEKRCNISGFRRTFVSAKVAFAAQGRRHIGYPASATRYASKPDRKLGFQHPTFRPVPPMVEDALARLGGPNQQIEFKHAYGTTR